MRGRDNNRISMIDTTIEYCEKNASATAGIGLFATVLGKVKAKKKSIDELNEKDGKWSVGVTTDTNSLRKRMSMQAVKCGSATAAYASSINNNTLVSKVNFGMEDLRRMKKDVVDDMCQGIHDATLANIGEVVNWGVTNGDVAELQSLINEYREKMQNPRQAIVTKKGANRQVKELVREIIDELLEKQLDMMVNTLEFSNDNFWRGYQMARNILDRGIVHAKIKGAMRNEDDVPLAGGTLTVYETGTQKVVKEAVSEKNGSFKVSPMPVGNFDFKWEMVGYVTKMESNVRVGLGKVVRRKVTLKRM